MWWVQDSKKQGVGVLMLFSLASVRRPWVVLDGRSQPGMVFQGRTVVRIQLCKFRRLVSVTRVAILHNLLVLFPFGVDGLIEEDRPASFVVFDIAAVGSADVRTPRVVFVACGLVSEAINTISVERWLW